MKPKKPCKHCQDPTPNHWPYKCPENPKKPQSINRVSIKQLGYELWLKRVAGPHITARDGYSCVCCGTTEGKLDIEHKLGKGSHPELKRTLKNLQWMCRFPCHRNKTDNVPCLHTGRY